MTLQVLLIIIYLPIFHSMWPPSACIGPQCTLSPLILAARDPDPLFYNHGCTPSRSRRVFSYSSRPLHHAAGITYCIPRALHQRWNARVVGAFPRATTRIERATNMGWWSSNGPTVGIYRLRSSYIYQRFFQFLKWRTISSFFGFTIFSGGVIVALSVGLVAVHRLYIAVSEHSELVLPAWQLQF